MRAGKSKGLKTSAPGPGHSGPSLNIEARAREKVRPIPLLVSLAAGAAAPSVPSRRCNAAVAAAAH